MKRDKWIEFTDNDGDKYSLYLGNDPSYYGQYVTIWKNSGTGMFINKYILIINNELSIDEGSLKMKSEVISFANKILKNLLFL